MRSPLGVFLALQMAWLTCANGNAFASTEVVSPDPRREALVRPTHGPGPWVLIGLGTAMVGVSAALIVLGDKHVADSEGPVHWSLADLPGLVQTANDRLANAALGQTMRAVGIVVGVLGLASVGGGAVWHFNETATSRLHFTPLVTTKSASTFVAVDF